MQLHLTGHHIEITPAIKEFTESKIDKLHHYADRITRTHVTLSVEKLRQIAEITIHIRGAELHAKAESSDLYIAIDEMVTKLERQLIKNKEKEMARRGDQ